MASLLSDADRKQLLINGHRTAGGDEIDPPCVVRLFIPGTRAEWHLTEIDPDDEDLAFGLCDLGLGFPELGYVRFSELRSLSATSDFVVVKDNLFNDHRTLSTLAAEGRGQ